MYEVPCPHCGARLQVPDAQAGKRGKCPACYRNIVAPGRPSSSDAIAAGTPPPGPETAITTPDQVLPAYPARPSADVAGVRRGLPWMKYLGCTAAAVVFGLALVMFVLPVCMLVHTSSQRVQT